MNALAATFREVSRTLGGSGLSFLMEDGFLRFYCDGERIGWLSETRRPEPDMRWKWDACGSYGYAATREKAIAAVESLLPYWRACRAKDRERAAKMAALPERLRAAVDAENRARFEYHRALYSNSSSSERRRRAELAWLDAKDARLEIEAELLESHVDDDLIH